MTNPTLPSICPKCGAEFCQPTSSRRKRIYCSLLCTKRVVNMRHREKNRGKLRAKSKAYYVENRDKIRDKAQVRYQTEQGERQRAWRRDNPERALQTSRKAYETLKLSSPWYNCMKNRREWAAGKGVEFSLTNDWAASVWTGVCSISGFPFDTRIIRKSGARRFSPSIDRIDPSEGYVPSNCRFVLHAINAFKYDGTDAEMLELAKAIVKSLSPQ